MSDTRSNSSSLSLSSDSSSLPDLIDESELDASFVGLHSENVDIIVPAIKEKLVKSKQTGLEYKVLNYDSDRLNAFPEAFAYKSVIKNPETDEILCYAPPASMDLASFRKQFDFNDETQSPLWINEIVEGTMMMLFYDIRKNVWELATRGSVGGNNWYFRTEYPGITANKQKTFRSMFIDALEYDDNKLVKDTVDLQEIALLQELPKRYCYCFVVQHPENHIVRYVDRPHAYLVGVFECSNSAERAESEYDIIPFVRHIVPTVYETWTMFKSSNVEFPQRIENVSSYEDCVAKFQREPSETTQEPGIFEPVGLMILDLQTGMRTAIQNDAYAAIKTIRGNHPNLEYHFYELHQRNQAELFLSYFPWYRTIFVGFYDKMIQMSYLVYAAYVAYYIHRNRAPIPKKYFIHAAKVHYNVYVPAMKSGAQKRIGVQDVRNYFETMTPSSLVYYMNYVDKNET